MRRIGINFAIATFGALLLTTVSMGARAFAAAPAPKPIAMYEDLKSGQFFATPGKNRVWH